MNVKDQWEVDKVLSEPYAFYPHKYGKFMERALRLLHALTEEGKLEPMARIDLECELVGLTKDMDHEEYKG